MLAPFVAKVRDAVAAGQPAQGRLAPVGRRHQLGPWVLEGRPGVEVHDPAGPDQADPRRHVGVLPASAGRQPSSVPEPDGPALARALFAAADKLDELMNQVDTIQGTYELADSYCHQVLPAMGEVRAAADQCEIIIGKDYWPLPSYSEMLFYV